VLAATAEREEWCRADCVFSTGQGCLLERLLRPESWDRELAERWLITRSRLAATRDAG